MRSQYVAQLETGLQTIIKNQLINYYKDELELNNEDLKVELELAMNSRVSDLEDTIDINTIFHQS